MIKLDAKERLKRSRARAEAQRGDTFRANIYPREYLSKTNPTNRFRDAPLIAIARPVEH
jgi:hypothetical protein